MESTVHYYGYLGNEKKMTGMSTCSIHFNENKSIRAQSYAPCAQNSSHFVILLSLSLIEIQINSWFKNLEAKYEEYKKIQVSA